jgi:hypothetical protein
MAFVERSIESYDVLTPSPLVTLRHNIFANDLYVLCVISVLSIELVLILFFTSKMLLYLFINNCDTA